MLYESRKEHFGCRMILSMLDLKPHHFVKGIII